MDGRPRFKKRFNNNKINKKQNSKFQHKNGNSNNLFQRKSGNSVQLFQQQVARLKLKYDQIDAETVKLFSHLPLTDRTLKGLKAHKYKVPTEIQKESIGYALKGRDILGAAKTGSGKTLAFVIPVLECLYREGWTTEEGLGALIITPTRELAYQIYEVINKVGQNHLFSVALVIGGKDLKKERKSLNKCNIIICTPGRILQHMDENPLFDAMNLKILVLDEADRILDLGFATTVNAIIDNLPPERQTLLFSATQTKSVKDLARLSLKDPVYVSVHEHAQYSTPEFLNQHYMVCEAQHKLDLLWSFLQSNRKQKTLVFMASCKQVKFTYDTFRLLRPGLTVLPLYGDLPQLKRMALYDEFCRKSAAVMFSTDIACRGLDFPNVNWVIQLDCPEDVDTYIHRVGRTARYKKGGEAVLVLLPPEKDSMVQQLINRKIPITSTIVNPKRLVSIQNRLEGLLARNVELKETAQRAFKAYFKNIFLMKDKTVFDVTKIDPEAYARSLGMAFAPRIRFIEKRLKNSSKPQIAYDSTDTFHKNKNNASSTNATDSLAGFRAGDSDSEDEFLKFKESKHDAVESDKGEIIVVTQRKKKPLSNIALAKKALRKNIHATVVKFDDDGQPIGTKPFKPLAPDAQELVGEMVKGGYDIEKAKLIMEKEDIIDKKLYQQRLKERIKEKRLKKIKETHSEKEDLEEQDSEADIPIDIKETHSEKEDSEEQDSEADIPIDINMSDSESERGTGNSCSSSFEDQQSSEEQPVKGKKRKRQTDDLPNKLKSIRGKRDMINFSDGLVSVDEDLALHFLKNS